MNQKQKTMLKRIVAAAIVYIAAAAAKKMNVFAEEGLDTSRPSSSHLFTSHISHTRHFSRVCPRASAK